jgi:UDP-N-acetylglucosamine--N-acetylmuramyl-(pentapeptide) pyrophosphoryl-undecaprenol N-acetylglucosamine transferase
VGIGAILVPLKAAIDDHQAGNARHFAANGAGIVLTEDELSPRRLADELARCLADDERLVAMAEAAHAQARERVAATIADACLAAAKEAA